MFPKIFDKISSSSLPRILQTEIICGDCGGDELLPLRTNLTTTGACAVCGGRSYVIASPICEALARHLKSEQKRNNNYETFENKNAGRDCIEIGGTLRH